MREPAFTSVEAMKVLHDDGIRAGRERVTRMVDDLFGNERTGKHRRISLKQMTVIRDAFRLIDGVGLPRDLVIALCLTPDSAFAALSDDMRRSKAALVEAVADAESGISQFQEASSADERLEAARRIRRAIKIRKVRRLVAA